MAVFIVQSLIVSLFLLLVLSYMLYPVFLSLLKKSQSQNNFNVFPENSKIHLLIACYNEEAVIEKKIRNSFSLEAPRKLLVHVIVDESTDDTIKIALSLKEEFEHLFVYNKGYRKGKNDSLNYFFEVVQPDGNDVIFFTDANTFYNKDGFFPLWSELQNGAVVVGGSMKYVDQDSSSAKSEGIYWKYEEWIRRNEAKMGRVITMNGGNMAMIAKYFKPQELFVPNDFNIPLSLVSHHKSSFAYSSIGIEKAIMDVQEELDRKKRMANRQMNAIILRWAELSFISKVQVLLHKVIRWFALPIFIMISSLVVLLAFLVGPNILLWLVIGIWVMFLISHVWEKQFKYKLAIISLINYAFAVHFYGGLGAINALLGKRVSRWGKAQTNRQ